MKWDPNDKNTYAGMSCLIKEAGGPQKYREEIFNSGKSSGYMLGYDQRKAEDKSKIILSIIAVGSLVAYNVYPIVKPKVTKFKEEKILPAVENIKGKISELFCEKENIECEVTEDE